MPGVAPIAAARLLQSPRGRGLAAGCCAGSAGVLALAIVLPVALLAALLRGVSGSDAGAGCLAAGRAPLVSCDDNPAATSVVPLACPHLAVARGFQMPVHSGIDLDCPISTPVRSLTDGVLRRRADYGGSCVIDGVTRMGGYGTYAVVEPPEPDRARYYYAHLGGYAAEDGGRVTAGQVIGFEGSTGCSSGPHLHLEVRVGGVAANPCSRLAPDYPTPGWRRAGCPLYLPGTGG